MTDAELQSLVRRVVDRHLSERTAGGSRSEATSGPGADAPSGAGSRPGAPATAGGAAMHPSFVLLAGVVAPGGAISEGACLIEPAVRCTHCGYCQSYGH